jgi:MFS family permease
VSGAAASHRGGYRAVLHARDFRLLLSALTISKFGSWAYNVALAVFVYQATRSPAWVAGATLSRLFTALLLSPYAGVVAERYERVRLMVGSDLAASACMAMLATVAALHAPVALAVALAALTSAVNSVYTPAVKATTPSVLGEEHLAAANSLESTVDNLSVIAGPAIGAGLLLLGPPAVAFAVNAASFAYSAGVVSRMHARSVPTDVTEGGTAGPVTQVMAGVRSIGASSTVLLLVGFSTLASFVYGTDTVLLVVLSQSYLGTGATGYGYLLAGLGIGGIAGAALMNRVAASPRLGSLIAAGMLAYCLPTALVALVHVPAAVFMLQLLRGSGTVIVDVLAVTALQRLVAREVVARVFGVFWAMALGGICLGTVLAPLLLAALGLRGALLVMGLAIPAGVALAYPRLRQVDRAGVAELARIGPRVAVLRELDILSGASRPVLERLAVACTEQQLDEGTTIIREGDAADDFYVLVAGEVAVSARSGARRRRSLGTLVPPAYFGEIGLLEQLPRTATVEATAPSVVYRIDGGDFVEAMTESVLSPGALGLAEVRLRRTHPRRRITFMAGTRAG